MFIDNVMYHNSSELFTYNADDNDSNKIGNVLVIKNIGKSLELLLNFAIEGTRAFDLLKKMRDLCFQEFSERQDDQHSASTEEMRYLSFIFKYVSTGNIPMAFSAIAPCFLFDINWGKQDHTMKREVESFLNVTAADQTTEMRKNMAKILLSSINLYSSITTAGAPTSCTL